MLFTVQALFTLGDWLVLLDQVPVNVVIYGFQHCQIQMCVWLILSSTADVLVHTFSLHTALPIQFIVFSFLLEVHVCILWPWYVCNPMFGTGSEHCLCQRLLLTPLPRWEVSSRNAAFILGKGGLVKLEDSVSAGYQPLFIWAWPLREWVFTSKLLCLCSAL